MPRNDGKAWERTVRKWLSDKGIAVTKPRQTGFVDTGDLHVAALFVLQAKDWSDTTSALREGVHGAEQQAEAAGLPFGVAVIKRRRSPTGDSYVAMSLNTFQRLVHMIRKELP